jgi:hypothetical protein
VFSRTVVVETGQKECTTEESREYETVVGRELGPVLEMEVRGECEEMKEIN